MIKDLVKIALVGASVSATWCSAAQASNTGAGNIKLITPVPGIDLLFVQTGTRTTPPSCATNTRWALDTSTSTGQAAAAVLLTAYATGKQIVVYGTGTCTLHPDSETVSFFQIVDP
jgi:hypothetical protein